MRRAAISFRFILMNSSFATIGAGNPRPRVQTLLGLGIGRKPTAYQQIRGGTDFSRPFNQDLIPNILSCAETTG
jgi:hypothetical protein